MSIRRLVIMLVVLAAAGAALRAGEPPVAVAKPVTVAATEVAQSKLVNINTATLKELQKLKGVGPATARRIIEYREQHGTFVKIEDLKKVKGIGPKKLEQMRAFVTLAEQPAPAPEVPATE